MAAPSTPALADRAPLESGRGLQRRTELGDPPIRRTRRPHGADGKTENLS
ncbi:hypothetical protein [Mycobacterium sp. OAE908]